MSVSFLTFVVVQPFSLSVVTIWRLTRAEVVLKRIFKSALGLLLLAAMIIGSIFIQGIPRRLNEAIAEPAKPPKEAPIKFANWPQGLHNMPDIEFDGADHLLIKFRIVAANPRDTTVFLDRTMILQLFANESKPISLYLYVNESFESTDPLTLLAKDSRLINCQGQLERREYQEMAGRKVRFAILASWYDLTKGGLERNSDWILDDEGYILDFKQVTEPKLKVEKSKKKP
ncbi:MAG: hypothetical protein ND866_09540 [Pyrinomonadaceae bacterium]|nr:hypothetical protein [Pyrinomonadaceae bacterium]